MLSVLDAAAKTGTPKQSIWPTFWGAHQRYFKQLCISVKVPLIVEEARAALENGNCVVIGLQVRITPRHFSDMGLFDSSLRT